jgi:hypothetical protein
MFFTAWKSAAAVALVCSALVGGGVQAQSPTFSGAGTTGKTVHKKKARAASRKPPKDTQGADTERTRRLARECIGRPNAGACAGYAS